MACAHPARVQYAMKFGSVAFFKKLIVAVFILMLLAAVAAAVALGVLYHRQKERADFLETVNWAMMNTTPLPEDLQYPEDIAEYLQNPPAEAPLGPSFAYQKAFPELYVNRPVTAPTEGKVCYLTFDDGPSTVTLQVLKTLGDYGIKATFFVTGESCEQNADVLRAAAEAGHTIGVHTFSHAYADIYASVDAYLADFEKLHTLVTETTGTAPTIFRFPGGSINVYNQGLYQQLIAEMTRRGFAFFDWNAAASDAVRGGATRQEILQNALESAAGRERVVLLAHDRQDNVNTAAALPDIIDALAEQGYRFEPLTAGVEPLTFFYEDYFLYEGEED